MKVSVTKSSLELGLQRVHGVIAGGSTLPVLQCVKVVVEESRVVLEVTDLDVGMRTGFEVQGAVPGVAVVPYKVLSGAVKRCSGELLQLELEGNRLLVVSGDEGEERVRLGCYSAEEFPAWAEVKGGKALGMPMEALAWGLKHALRYVSDDATRYVLGGVLVENCEDGVRFVATDGRRLVCLDSEAMEDNSDRVQGILPGKVAKLLAGMEGEAVGLRFSETMVGAVCGGVEVVGKLIEGQFPNWGQVVPGKGKVELVLDRADALGGLDLVGVLGADGVKVEWAKEGVKLSANSPDVGDAEVVVEGSLSGKKFAVAFNRGFLADGLKVMEGDRVVGSIEDEASPLLLEEKAGQKRARVVVMPMRVS